MYSVFVLYLSPNAITILQTIARRDAGHLPQAELEPGGARQAHQDRAVRLKLIAASSSSHSHKYDDLARMIGATRRFLRLGTCVDALYSSFLSVSHPDSFVRMTVTLSHIANAMYLFCDHLLFLHHNKLLRINVKKWDNLSDRCWLYSIVMDLVRNIYQINCILTKLGILSSSNSLLYFMENHKNLIVDTIKNAADLILPLTSLGKKETWNITLI